jgi:hypothetical protein
MTVKPIALSWNPMLNYPRNAECFCDSGKKFKKCCLKDLPLLIPVKAAHFAQPLIQAERKKRK